MTLPGIPLFYIDRQGRRQTLGSPSAANCGEFVSVSTALRSVTLEYARLVEALLTGLHRPETLLPFLDDLRGAVQKAQESVHLKLREDGEIAYQRSQPILMSRSRTRPTLDDVIGALE